MVPPSPVGDVLIPSPLYSGTELCNPLPPFSSNGSFVGTFSPCESLSPYSNLFKRRRVVAAIG